MVATRRGDDTDFKGRYVWHNAGMNSRGGSSYIDACVLRDRDINSGWTASGDGTLEERVYYAQNWRADVSVVLSSGGTVKEWVKYSSYGVPFSITPADFNGDGFVSGTDDDDFDIAYNGGAGAWDARVDLDLDGTLDSDDDTLFTAEFVAGEVGGYRVLSRASVANRLGYAGYQHAPELAKTRWHVRHRVLDSETGRWTRRDPIGYIDGDNLFVYANNYPIMDGDSHGLQVGIGPVRIVNPPAPPVEYYPPEYSLRTHNVGRRDTWVLRSRPIDGIGQLSMQEHCWVECTPANSGTTTSYSLLNKGGIATPVKDDPADKGRGKAASLGGGSGTCACIAANFSVNSATFPYSPNNNNSNSFANILVNCCGLDVPRPSGAWGWNYYDRWVCAYSH